MSENKICLFIGIEQCLINNTCSTGISNQDLIPSFPLGTKVVLTFNEILSLFLACSFVANSCTQLLCHPQDWV